MGLHDWQIIALGFYLQLQFTQHPTFFWKQGRTWISVFVFSVQNVKMLPCDNHALQIQQMIYNDFCKSVRKNEPGLKSAVHKLQQDKVPYSGKVLMRLSCSRQPNETTTPTSYCPLDSTLGHSWTRSSCCSANLRTGTLLDKVTTSSESTTPSAPSPLKQYRHKGQQCKLIKTRQEAHLH